MYYIMIEKNGHPYYLMHVNQKGECIWTTDREEACGFSEKKFAEDCIKVSTKKGTVINMLGFKKDEMSVLAATNPEGKSKLDEDKCECRTCFNAASTWTADSKWIITDASM